MKNLLLTPWTLVVILIIILLMREGCYSRSEDKLVQQIASYSDSAKHYSLELANHKKQDVATNSVIEVNSQAQLTALAGKNDTIKRLFNGFKTANTVVVTKQVDRIVHDTVTLTEQIPCSFKPIDFTQVNTWYRITGKITSTDLIIDSLISHDVQSIVIGTKRKGLFGSVTSLDVIHQNPYVSVNGIAGYQVKESHLTDRWWFQAGAGFLGGWVARELLVK